jgi:hypothetical protein
MAWRWIGYAMLMDMARGREVSDRIERMGVDFVDINADVNFVVSGEINVVEKVILLC